MEKATNGQFREFIGKLLVKGSDENIALIDKLKIQTAIDDLSSNKDTVFENLIRFINEGCFNSRWFRKVSVIKVKKNPSFFRINENFFKDFLKPVILREKQLKNPEFWINTDLWEYFNNGHCNIEKVAGFMENLTVVTYRSLKPLNQKQVFYEAELIGIKKIYTYSEALSIIRQAILNGEADGRNKFIRVYFQIVDDGTLFHLTAGHSDNSPLNINVQSVYLEGSGLNSDQNICF